MAITRSTRGPSEFVSERAFHATALWTAKAAGSFLKNHRKLALVIGVWLGTLTGAFGAYGQAWHATESLSLESTLTNNVGLVPNDQRKADWVNQLTPSVRFTEQSAHTKFAGSISLPILLYARTSENNYVAPEVAIAGTVEAIDKFLFVDTSVNVSQQYRTPFGAVPSNLANATNNRYTAQSYTISPYIRGLLANNIDYELRDTSSWGAANGVGNGNSYNNDLNGHITRAPRPFGWSADVDRSELHSVDRVTEITQIARLHALYVPEPTVELSTSIGYENNRFEFNRQRGLTYGVGVTWHPTERTNLDAMWEHRFFGSAYHVLFDHRTPLSVWSVRASRDLTNYPLQLATLSAGGDVAALLNGLLLSRVPDPTQRQQLVDRFIHDRGLPNLLQGPVPLFSQQTTLLESQTATVGILGARNSILFTVFRSRNQPIQGSDLEEISDLLADSADTTQVGLGATWTYRLASDLTWATNLTFSRATFNRVRPSRETGEPTDQYALSTILSRPISPFTSVYGGARFQESKSDPINSYREIAVFFGASYIFH